MEIWFRWMQKASFRDDVPVQLVDATPCNQLRPQNFPRRINLPAGPQSEPNQGFWFAWIGARDQN